MEDLQLYHVTQLNALAMRQTVEQHSDKAGVVCREMASLTLVHTTDPEDKNASR